MRTTIKNNYQSKAHSTGRGGPYSNTRDDDNTYYEEQQNICLLIKNITTYQGFSNFYRHFLPIKCFKYPLLSKYFGVFSSIWILKVLFWEPEFLYVPLQNKWRDSFETVFYRAVRDKFSLAEFTTCINFKTRQCIIMKIPRVSRAKKVAWYVFYYDINYLSVRPSRMCGPALRISVLYKWSSDLQKIQVYYNIVWRFSDEIENLHTNAKRTATSSWS